MNLNEYQNEVMRTAAMGYDRKIRLAVLALGAAGEAGETADIIKKVLGHGHDLDVPGKDGKTPREKLKLELGDQLWYVAALANALGFELEDVGMSNVMKLRARYPDGFSVEASKVKADEAAHNADPRASLNP